LGFVVGGVDADFFVVVVRLVVDLARDFVGLFVVNVPAGAPVATRDECFARCLTALFGAASAIGAIAPSAKTVMNPTANSFSVFRIIVNLGDILPQFE
jgi:hypothetical protein